MFRRKSKVAIKKPRSKTQNHEGKESPTSVVVPSSIDANNILIMINESGNDLQTAATQDTNSTAATTEYKLEYDDASRSTWNGRSFSSEGSTNDNSSGSVTTLSYHSDSITYDSKNTLDYSENGAANSQGREQGDEFNNDDEESFSTSRESLSSTDEQLLDIASVFPSQFSNNLSFLGSIWEQLQCKSPAVEEDDFLWRGCISTDSVEKENSHHITATKDSGHAINEVTSEGKEPIANTEYVANTTTTKSSKGAGSVRSSNSISHVDNINTRHGRNNVVVDSAKKPVKKASTPSHRFAPIEESTEEQQNFHQGVKRNKGLVSFFMSRFYFQWKNQTSVHCWPNITSVIHFLSEF
jgi:hypothetical protein